MILRIFLLSISELITNEEELIPNANAARIGGNLQMGRFRSGARMPPATGMSAELYPMSNPMFRLTFRWPWFVQVISYFLIASIILPYSSCEISPLASLSFAVSSAFAPAAAVYSTEGRRATSIMM